MFCVYWDDIPLNLYVCLFLQPLDPEQVAVVTLSASKEIIFEGGPQPWVLDPNRYYQEGSVPKIISITREHNP